MGMPERNIMAMPDRPHSSGLLVEDVRAMRTYLRTMLQVENVQIDEAGSLREAREFLRNTAAASPDFIVLDLELPDGNGLDLMPAKSNCSVAKPAAIWSWRKIMNCLHCAKSLQAKTAAQQRRTSAACPLPAHTSLSSPRS